MDEMHKSCCGGFQESRAGAANVGPEFTILGYDALAELCATEDKLYCRCFLNGKEMMSIKLK